MRFSSVPRKQTHSFGWICSSSWQSLVKQLSACTKNINGSDFKFKFDIFALLYIYMFFFSFTCDNFLFIWNFNYKQIETKVKVYIYIFFSKRKTITYVHVYLSICGFVYFYWMLRVFFCQPIHHGFSVVENIQFPRSLWIVLLFLRKYFNSLVLDVF